MANIHDYHILNKKSERYAKLLADNVGVDFSINDEEKRRLGFYIFALEQICNDSDISNIIDCVIDTRFNELIYGERYNDAGVDAVYINSERKEVKLFNFKFRNSFNPSKSQSLNDNFISTKFLNLVLSDDKNKFDTFPNKIKDKLYSLSDILIRPQDEWKVELFQVSNEAKEVIETTNELEDLARLYAIKVKAVALDTISEFMSIRPDTIDAKLILSSDSVMSYSEDTNASAKSFIARMPCSEILRITSDIAELRESLQPLDSDSLAKGYLDFGVLFDNVRGLVKNSKYNLNIANTLKKEPKKFFMYNNGITLIAEDIKAKPLAGNKSVKIELYNIQIVNGGQTVRTIHDFNKEDKEHLDNYLYDAEVLVRMFMPDSEIDEAHKIAEFTNSQNPIKAVNLKSLASEQINIEKYLEEHGIAYARKAGDTGSKDDIEYKYTIGMETFGKILKARFGQPDKATSSVKGIFEEQYQDLFVKNFDLSEAPRLVELYFDTIKKYKELGIKGNQLKYYYIQYFDKLGVNKSLEELIHYLEWFLSKHSLFSDLGDVKTLGSSAFKKDLYDSLESTFS
ncbi:AIPR family protein [Vibrio campbellii]|uniref:AIPR family protein n=1 Tax=Vibrio campbellii TaxID=680 RepID=UPI0005F091E2|nr:AIPR family protein [Vibrio campbellii]